MLWKVITCKVPVDALVLARELGLGVKVKKGKGGK